MNDDLPERLSLLAMMHETAQSESRFQRWRFRVPLVLGPMPQAGNENSALALRDISFFGPDVSQGNPMIQARLHHVNSDLGDVVASSTRSHF